jgi:hypothetical protein
VAQSLPVTHADSIPIWLRTQATMVDVLTFCSRHRLGGNLAQTTGLLM